jgi:parallel beta-helix repeat protein
VKKFVTLAFVLVLLPTAVVVVFVRPVVSQVTIGTIYIKSDGSVEGTDKIQRDGNIYTFTDNIVNQSIIVERDNIVVDGAGYILQGTEAFDSVGIDLTGRKNIIIKNMKIRAFRFGIHLNESSANNIYENNITNNVYGVLFEDSSNNSISGNNVENWPFNIFFFYSSNNTISGNTITKGGSGGSTSANLQTTL